MTRSMGFGLAIAATMAMGSSGCIAQNMLGRQVAIEEHPYAFGGDNLSYFEATTTDEKGISEKARPPGYTTLPVALFIEGDGGECQSYGQPNWYRFMVAYTGHYVLVRPRGFMNVNCGKDKWKKADFQSRIDEVATIVTALKASHPGQPIVLVGHSAGAHIAALYVASHPGDIAAIVDMAGGVDDLEKVMKQGQREKGLGSKELNENERDIDATVSHLKTPDPDKPLWGRTEKFWSQFLSMETRDLWMKTTVPVLVLHSEDDVIVPYSLMPKAKREMNRAGKDNFTWTFLSGGGHDLVTSDVFMLVDRWIFKKIGKHAHGSEDE